MNYFQDILENLNPQLKILPLMHKCDAYRFMRILENAKLEVRHCKYLEKDVFFTFYGKPEYRINNDIDNTDCLSYYPVCFILNTDNLCVPYKMFPFDSGAFDLPEGIKEKYLHPDMKLEEFELMPSYQSAVLIVQKFFNSNKKYLTSKPSIQSSEIPVINLHAQHYVRMITDGNKSTLDNRKNSIEVVFDQHIYLNKDTVLNIILPGEFLDTKDVKNILENEWNIEAIPYDIAGGNPNDYHSDVRKLVIEFLDINNFLKV